MNMDFKNRFSLEGKVVVVTGGTGILGHSFIKAIHQAGGHICILGRNESVATQRADDIIKMGGKAMPVVADVTKKDQLMQAADQIIKKFGRIDGLVNAAGGNMPQAVVLPEHDLFDLNMEAMREVVDLNLWGTIQPTLVFGKYMAENGGSIVNISSVSADRTLTRVLGYSLGKAAIDCFTKWFAVELANRYSDKIRMNTLMPGFFLTEQNRTLLTNEQGGYTPRGHAVVGHTPFKRFGDPSELEGALIWLLSNEIGRAHV